MRKLIGDLQTIAAKGEVCEVKLEKMCRTVESSMDRIDFMSAVRDVDKPGRYLIHKDEETGFVVMIMVWGPGQETPIHDHGTWGVEALLNNTLDIVSYSECQENPKPLKEFTLSAGQVMCNCPPKRDVHRVKNNNASITWSLHIYGSDMDKNRIFKEGEGYQPCALETINLEFDQLFPESKSS